MSYTLACAGCGEQVGEFENADYARDNLPADWDWTDDPLCRDCFLSGIEHWWDWL